MDFKDLLKKLTPAAAAAALLLGAELSVPAPALAAQLDAAVKAANEGAEPSVQPLVFEAAKAVGQEAQHRSHRSHSSHRSHRSHYSNRT